MRQSLARSIVRLLVVLAFASVAMAQGTSRAKTACTTATD